jgi:alpha-tubulin suppressor-like RCC1 family protein
MKHLLLTIITLITINASSQCIKSMFSGAGHSAIVKQDGTLWTWGRNTNGQLGNGNTQLQNLPIQIGIDTNWKSVSGHAYSNSLLILKEDNTLWSTGENDY